MGIGLMETIWTQSTQEDAYRLLLLAIANNANDDTRVGWPGIAYLAVRIRKSERQTQRLIHDLAETGDLAVEWGVGRGNPNIYHVLTGLSAEEIADRKALVDQINNGSEASEARYNIQKGDTRRHHNQREKSIKKVTADGIKGDIGDKKGDIEDKKGDIAMSTEPSIEPSNKLSLKPSEGKSADAAPSPLLTKPVLKLDPSKPKAKPERKETPEETAYFAACVPVMARVCQIDLNITGGWARCKKVLQALYHATIRPTPELLERHYGQPDGYWFSRDWRGQKGDTPEPHFIQNTWGKATSLLSSTANGKPALRPTSTVSRAQTQADAMMSMLTTIRAEPEFSGEVIEGGVVYG